MPTDDFDAICNTVNLYPVAVDTLRQDRRTNIRRSRDSDLEGSRRT